MIWLWENINIDEIVRKFFYKFNINHGILPYILDKIFDRGTKIVKFKIMGLIL
jgi:hypothetical protein